jgi:hypothetical protein
MKLITTIESIMRCCNLERCGNEAVSETLHTDRGVQRWVPTCSTCLQFLQCRGEIVRRPLQICDRDERHRRHLAERQGEW